MTAAATDSYELVGPYRVLRAIGAGGSARIDLARIDRAYGFQRHVVIKRPLEHLRTSSQVAASLRREARIASRLRHPNLVAVLDAGMHDGYDYLALEYVHGASLRTLMEHDTPGRVHALPVGAALAIVADVARGMHAAHELTDEQGSPLGLVHRDVSPGNILLGLDGAVKLADFGIAKETRVSTLSGSLHGTVTYMAPEQCQGHAFDRRADLWALGVILYELLTGTRLFWADNDVASLHRVLSGAIPRPREIDPAIPRALESIVLIALAHEPDDRFPTALALAEAIEGYAAGAGEVLGARWIARAMDERIGRRDVPWIASTTPVDGASRRGDGSLVELIAATDDGAELAASFGEAGGEPNGEPGGEPNGEPNDGLAAMSGSRTMPLPASAPFAVIPALFSTPASAPFATVPGWPSETVPAPRKPRWLAGLVAVGLVGGSAATAFVMTRDRVPSATATTQISTPRAPTSTTPAPAAPTSTTPAPAAPTPAVPVAPAPTTPTTPPVQAPTPTDAPPAAELATPQPAKRKHGPGRGHSPHTDAKPTPAVTPAVIPEAPPVAPPAPPPPPRPANVEWKPSLLLPTDSSGTGK